MRKARLSEPRMRWVDYLTYYLWRAGLLCVIVFVWRFMVGFRSGWNAERPDKAPEQPKR